MLGRELSWSRGSGFLSGLFILLFQVLVAQDYVDVARLEYEHGSRNRVDGRTSDIRFSEVALDLNLPLVVNDRLAIVTGVLAEVTSVANAVVDTTVVVHGHAFKAGFNHKHSQKWSGTYLLLPKVSSDLESVGGRDIQIGVLALLKYGHRPGKNFRFGVYANDELSGPLVVPIIGYYGIHGRWELNAALPINADVNYRFLNRLRIGAQFKGIYKSYDLESFQPAYLEKVNNELGAYLQMHVDNWNFRLLAGHSIARKIREFSADDQLDFAISAVRFGDRPEPPPSTQDGILFRLAVIYRIPTDN